MQWPAATATRETIQSIEAWILILNDLDQLHPRSDLAGYERQSTPRKGNKPPLCPVGSANDLEQNFALVMAE